MDASEIASTLEKYKSLLDSGALTQGEFDALKGRLLEGTAEEEPVEVEATEEEPVEVEATEEESAEGDNSPLIVSMRVEDGWVVAVVFDPKTRLKSCFHQRYILPSGTDARAFCGQVADIVEHDMGRKVQWSMPQTVVQEEKATDAPRMPRRPRKVLVAVAIAVGIVAASFGAYCAYMTTGEPKCVGSVVDAYVYMRGRNPLGLPVRMSITDDVMSSRSIGNDGFELGDGMSRIDVVPKGVSVYTDSDRVTANGVVTYDRSSGRLKMDGADVSKLGDSAKATAAKEKEREKQEAEAALKQIATDVAALQIGSEYHWHRSGDYVTFTSTLTNNGSRTYRFVKVKATFYDANGTQTDTDWTYAAGSEGLAPGETTQFEFMEKDAGHGHDNVSFQIMDYQ